MYVLSDLDLSKMTSECPLCESQFLVTYKCDIWSIPIQKLLIFPYIRYIFWMTLTFQNDLDPNVPYFVKYFWSITIKFQMKGLEDKNFISKTVEIRNFWIALSDLDLSKMTWRDLGPQVRVPRNICNKLHQCQRYELGRTDGRTDRHDGDYMLPENFRGA